jgi:hypothetical protein
MDEPCPICYEEIKYKATALCGHIFCTPCLLRWGKESDSCPLCRKNLIINENENEDNDTDSVISKDEDEEIICENTCINRIILYSISIFATLNILLVEFFGIKPVF